MRVIYFWFFFILRDIYFVSFGGMSNYSLKIIGRVSNDFYQINLLKELINLIFSPSSCKRLIRMHTEDALIRPFINWQNAPECNFAKRLTHSLPVI